MEFLANRVRVVAYSYADFTELPPNTNHGQVVERFIRFVGLDPKDNVPWCAAFVYYVGYWALFDHVSRKSAWPLPKTAGCAVLGEFATAKGVLHETPQPMDIMLRYYPSLGRFAHTGFVIGAVGDKWRTIEGNTSKQGDTDPKTQREGWGVFEHTDRVWNPRDRFIRWVDLLK